MIELARAQDEEVGDGTTSVIILAGEILAVVEGFLEKDIHPTVIVSAYMKCLEELVRVTESLGVISLSSLFIYRSPSISRVKLTSKRL
jgi:T-complex protein 1 subunit gamma